jgi:3-hydroxyisobutyrate dehydrogenase-like beta-hydroxyacid dehydrogenase
MSTVAVLGLGNMGSAIADALLEAGDEVVVWNRTAAKCEPLAQRGAQPAPTAARAIESAPIVICSLSDYRSLHEVMGPWISLQGRTLVNLIWGTPTEAETCADVVARLGGTYVEGNPLCRPADIAGPAGDILYSGPLSVIETHRAVLGALGPVHNVGSDITLANTLALALGPPFYAGVLSFLEAVAFAARLGISVDVVAPLIRIPLMLAASTAVASVEQINRGDFSGSDGSNAVHAAALVSAQETFVSAGVEHRLIDAMLSYFDSASVRGLDDLEIGALLQVMAAASTEDQRPD